tara:strand:- start:295 stop:477 length:183 start_codon:yes stop_codon:yes gene_type:complete
VINENVKFVRQLINPKKIMKNQYLVVWLKENIVCKKSKFEYIESLKIISKIKIPTIEVKI